MQMIQMVNRPVGLTYDIEGNAPDLAYLGESQTVIELKGYEMKKKGKGKTPKKC